MRAIVIDDSRAMRMILKGALMEAGFDCIDATDGGDALKLLNVIDVPELALIDWNMPVMNGYELLCLLRQSPRFNDMKIMMVTTENEMDQVVKAVNAGANEYVMKPFSTEALKEKLDILGFEQAAV